ncbi:hypothetical protein ACOME3_005017 [Neoechinorhynchus agilis]
MRMEMSSETQNGLIVAAKRIALVVDMVDEQSRLDSLNLIEKSFFAESRSSTNEAADFTRVFTVINSLSAITAFRGFFASLNSRRKELSQVRLLDQCIEKCLKSSIEINTLCIDTHRSEGHLLIAVDRLDEAINRFLSAFIIESSAFFCEPLPNCRDYSLFNECKLDVIKSLLASQHPTEALILSQFLNLSTQTDVAQFAIASIERGGLRVNERFFRALFNADVIGYVARELEELSFLDKLKMVINTISQFDTSTDYVADGNKLSAKRIRARCIVYLMIELALAHFKLIDFTFFPQT